MSKSMKLNDAVRSKTPGRLIGFEGEATAYTVSQADRRTERATTQTSIAAQEGVINAYKVFRGMS